MKRPAFGCGAAVRFCAIVTISILSIAYCFSQIALKPEDNLIALESRLNKARTEKDFEALADAYFLIAEFYEFRNFNTGLALENYFYARDYYLRLGNDSRVNYIDRLLAQRLVKTGFYNEALDIYNTLLPYYQGISDESTVAYILYEISDVYRKKGESELNLQYLNRSIEINARVKDRDLQFLFLSSKIESYINLNELDSALSVSSSYFKLADMTNSPEDIGRALYYIGYVNEHKGDYEKAIKYLNNSLQMTPDKPYSEERREIYDQLAKSYAATNNFSEAFRYSQKYNVLNDSILNLGRLKLINELTIRHETNQKKKEVAVLEKEKESVLRKSLRQKRVLYFVGLSFLGLLAIVYYLIRFYNQRIRTEQIINNQKHEIDEQKIRELQDAIKISSMQSMIVGQEKERERIAKDLHDSLGGLLSTVKLQFDAVKSKLNGHNTMDQYVKASDLLDTAVEEVRTISRNLQPSALKKLGIVPAVKDLINRFDGENYPDVYFQHYNVPTQMDEMTAMNLYRIIQELLNNSIKHAQANEILIQINKEGDELYIQYEDDGKGFVFDEKLKKGMGLENIQSRINFLKAQLSIETAADEGLSVLIRLPLPPGLQDEEE